MIKAYLQLLRVPNIVTAAADVLTGVWIVASSMTVNVKPGALWLLVLSSCLLYAGGVVLNDVVDALDDHRERPERPIPSGKISRKKAAKIALFLLLSGLLCAWLPGGAGFPVALLLVTAIVTYNLWAKRFHGPGSITMGLCRSLNLCLGFSMVPGHFWDYAFLAAYPFTHIVAVTSLSRGETAGLSRHHVLRLAMTPCLIIISLLVMGVFRQSITLTSVFFISLYTAAAIFAFLPAIRHPQASFIRRGVKYGILSLVLLDAAMVGMFNHWVHAAAVASLMLISWFMSRWFSMT